LGIAAAAIIRGTFVYGGHAAFAADARSAAFAADARSAAFAADARSAAFAADARSAAFTGSSAFAGLSGFTASAPGARGTAVSSIVYTNVDGVRPCVGAVVTAGQAGYQNQSRNKHENRA
jgi:hypothetical protein